jgi:rubrerythrin
MRKTTTWITVLVLGLAVAGAAGISACGKKAEEAAEGTTYTCPMHAEVTSDKPGECPTCGMDLVPAEEVGEAEETMEAEETAATAYTCPMHPEVTSEEPGDCPTCGMDLVLAEEEGEAPSEEESGHGGM